MEFQECLAEASRESRSWLSDAAFSTCKLSSEAREEVVLGLLWSKDRYWRKHAECVSRQEDYVLSSWSRATWLDVVDVVDWVRNASVLGSRLVVEVNLAVGSNSYVFEEGVALDSTVDVRFVLLREADNLGVAATFEVEYTVVVPTVFVVTDELGCYFTAIFTLSFPIFATITEPL